MSHYSYVIKLARELLAGSLVVDYQDDSFSIIGLHASSTSYGTRRPRMKFDECIRNATLSELLDCLSKAMIEFDGNNHCWLDASFPIVDIVEGSVSWAINQKICLYRCVK